MVKYTLDNIEGIVFESSDCSKYKIHKEKSQLESLYNDGSSNFFDYSKHFLEVIDYLNNGEYKVITQPERTIELW